MDTQTLSTIANLIIAFANVTLFIIGYRTLRNDRHRIVKMEEVEKKKFAENVFAWIEKRTDKSIDICCRNGGSSVIYNVIINIVDTFGNSQGDSYEIDLMKPYEEINFTIHYDDSKSIANTIISFEDPTGEKWKRTINGRLFQFSDENIFKKKIPSDLYLNSNNVQIDSERRTLVKTIIWRIIGVLWTFVGAYIIILLIPKKFSSALFIASLIAIYHHSTRMVMYYFYERIWLQIKWDRSTGESVPMSLKEKILWTAGFLIAIFLILYFLIYISPKIEPK